MVEKNSEKEPSEEKYFSKGEIEGEPETDELPTSRIGIEKAGRKLILMGIWLLLAGFAAPLLIIHLVKTPAPQEHLLIFGVSHYQMLFVLFLSAALMVFTSMFYLKAKPLTLLFFFVLSLLSCFPFVFGLRHDLTLQQVILDVPFFSQWPFFVKPAYILIEYLIPLGIVIYLSLQMMSLFSKRPDGYAFLGVAIYLSIAAFLGISGLNQAGQPNIGSALAYIRGNQNQNETLPMRGEPPAGRSPARETADAGQVNGVRLPVPPARTTPVVVSGNSGNGGTEAPPPAEPAEITKVSRELRLLSENVEGLMAQINEMKALFLARQEKGGEKDPAPVSREEGSEATSEEKREILELREELRILSAKVDYITNAFNRMGHILAEQQGNEKKIETGVHASGAEIKKEQKETVAKPQAQ